MHKLLGIRRRAICLVSFGENVRNAFVGCGKVLCRLAFSESIECADPQVDVKQISRTGRQYGPYHRDMNTALVVPVTQSLENIVRYIGGGVRQQLGGVLLTSAMKQVAQRERRLKVDQHSDDCQRRPAQRKRIFRTGRRLPNAEYPCQRIEAVCQRNGGGLCRPGEVVAGKTGVVVPLDGLGNGGGLTIVPGIVSACDTLQIRKLQHHLRYQIALAQLGGPDGGGLIRADGIRQLLGHGDDALSFIQQASKLLLEYHATQSLLPRDQG